MQEHTHNDGKDYVEIKIRNELIGVETNNKANRRCNGEQTQQNPGSNFTGTRINQ